MKKVDDAIVLSKKKSMSTITSFETLKCWQASRELTNLVYTVSSKDRLARDFEMRDQIRRAALSVMNNIAEGFGRGTRKEFIRFLDIAHGSCIEVKSVTYVIEDQNYLPFESIQQIRTKADEVRGLTRGFIKYLKDKTDT